MNTFSTLTFCLLVSVKVIYAQETLPDPPTNFIESLSYTEETNEMNSIIRNGTKPLSNTDLGKLKPKKIINKVNLYLEQNGNQKKYITNVTNSEQQSYFSKVKTTYLTVSF